jgi:hypothetical protein
VRSIERWRGKKNSWARIARDENEPLGEQSVESWASIQMTAVGEVRTMVINRRACDRSRTGLAQAIAWYEVRATKYQPEGAQSVESRNHSRWLLGNYPHFEATGLGTVGSYLKVGMRAGGRVIERERGVAQVTV